MKEAIANVKKITLDEAKGIPLIDTCAFIHHFDHHEKIELLKKEDFVITSFNFKELLFIEHKLSEKIKESINKYLKKEKIIVVEINVNPGNVEEEKKYVNSIEPDILHIIHDPSDAVLYATALEIGSDIITRDKHHIYTQAAEKFGNKYGISIRNKF
ncbi:MAG: PIN domain-containing protein [Candidatus Woesearchaeota archaeon]